MKPKPEKEILGARSQQYRPALWKLKFEVWRGDLMGFTQPPAGTRAGLGSGIENLVGRLNCTPG